MSEAIDAALVRSGTWGSLWIDGEQVAECYGCQAKISKTKESVPRCRAMMEDSKLVSTKGTGSIRIYNATSRLIELEGGGAQDRQGPAPHDHQQSGRPR